MQPSLDTRRSSDRLVTRTDWLDSRHSFSFGYHRDPRNTHHGLLLVNNDDVVQPKTGFRTHPHQDVEIVTWVLEGELEHRDTLGNHGITYPGLAQRVTVPDAPFVHLFIARGAADLEGAGPLAEGDAVRLTAAGTPGLTADSRIGVEVLIWEMAPDR